MLIGCTAAASSAGIVVFSSTSNDVEFGVMTVHKVQGDGVLLDGNRNFALTHLIRTATTAELKAKQRLPAPVALFVPVDLSPNSPDEARHLHRALGAQGWVT
ncbi:hypothetical protein EXE25_15465 [Acinetobacter bouvetii]|uniref:Uncharacterized protein n=2 Tax=Acinetobacter bouvetii TaxID=202951 RepID=A0A4Q7ASJ6_9GAMM|nr:hypothetical protein EXE25_15465 [Acinetobacter bouvetii]